MSDLSSKERVSDIDLPWLIAAYENASNPATFRREVALALRELLELRTAHEPPAAHDRDTDWILAIGHALGLESGFKVPIVPRVEPFQELFAVIRERAAQPPGDAVSMAIKFHEAYERLAPLYGYETRTDTRQFDPESKNGRLMVAVCMELFGLPMPRLPQMIAQQAERIRNGLDERYTSETKSEGAT